MKYNYWNRCIYTLVSNWKLDVEWIWMELRTQLFKFRWFRFIFVVILFNCPDLLLQLKSVFNSILKLDIWSVCRCLPSFNSVFKNCHLYELGSYLCWKCHTMYMIIYKYIYNIAYSFYDFSLCNIIMTICILTYCHTVFSCSVCGYHHFFAAIPFAHAPILCNSMITLFVVWCLFVCLCVWVGFFVGWLVVG